MNQLTELSSQSNDKRFVNAMKDTGTNIQSSSHSFVQALKLTFWSTQAGSTEAAGQDLEVIGQGANLDEYLVEDTVTGARAIRNRKFLNPVYDKGVHFSKDLVSESELEEDHGKV